MTVTRMRAEIERSSRQRCAVRSTRISPGVDAVSAAALRTDDRRAPPRQVGTTKSGDGASTGGHVREVPKWPSAG